ncbi:MAG: TIGR04086 family membrane protein [Clostridiales bacterium]|jgi:putative membrane protein (TIGR04086 family)|nr:TIGR04086 family membrane protein [Bacillota bacterium]NLK02878.1 TIGR04086 family membrane protein [Clostridiales bacterium]
MNKEFYKNARVIYILEGLVLSYIVTGLILLLFSFLMLKLELTSAIISGAINLAYIVSTFIGGFFIGKRAEQKKFIWGLLVGVFYFVVLMLISLMMNSGGALPLGSLFTVFIITSLSGMLGGMIS